MTLNDSNRHQIALPRHPRQRHPMSIHKRRALESRSLVLRGLWSLFHSLRGFCGGTARRRSRAAAATTTSTTSNAGRYTRSDLDVDSPFDELGDHHHDKTQYTLKSVRSSSTSYLNLRRFLNCTCNKTQQQHYIDTAESSSYWDINSLISSYLSFSHRTSYFLLFVVFSLVYYFNILLFALVYWGFSLYYPECITSAGSEIGEGERSDLFGDSFVLSWTTFSTVGYGSIYPSTGANHIEEALPRKCMIVGIIGSFEAFVGVLYAGFCTAVLFGKVIRSQSQAQIYFSDPLVIRYGKEELMMTPDNNTNTNRNIMQSQDVELGETLASIQESRAVVEQKKEGQIDDDVHNIPCPSLEFRLVNRLHDVVEGEIVEAQLDCVAILDNNIAADTTHSNEMVLQSSSNLLGNNATAIDTTNNSQPTSPTSDIERPTTLSFHHPSSKQPRAIAKLTLESNEHPFFRRVWFGRHRLDEHSPLLTEHVRNKIKRNGGYWPAELNNHRSIRDNLHFKHVLVCFSGTSNANATSVYAQKVYDLIDVNVGYRFVPMNYHAETGELKTDSYLLNAISEQRGGGAEPF